MERGRTIAWTTATASLAVLAVSVTLMVRRVERFHREHPRQVFAFQPLDEREFKFAGKPVTITDDKSDAEHPKVLVTYGEDKLEIPVSVPPKYELPGLKSHEDWMRVVRFGAASGLTPEQFQASLLEGKDRLAIVTRTPAPGVDPRTWGVAWRTNWVFDFYELMPEGGFFHERLRYPTKSGASKPVEGELHENTWEFQAALLLIPKEGADIGPTRNFYGDALAAANWTLPAAAFSGLTAILGLAFALAPRRRVRPSFRRRD
jgi:hypothetical protein